MKGDIHPAAIRLSSSLPVRTHMQKESQPTKHAAYMREFRVGRPKGAKDYAPRPLKTDTPSPRALKNREKRAEHWSKYGEKSITIPKL